MTNAMLLVGLIVVCVLGAIVNEAIAYREYDIDTPDGEDLT